MSDQLLKGWDFTQWAVAIKRCGIGGTRMKDIDKCRREYKERFGHDPLEFQLIGVVPDGDYDLATAIFEQYECQLETHTDEVTQDSSYGDQTRDDKAYDEAWQIRYGLN